MVYIYIADYGVLYNMIMHKIISTSPVVSNTYYIPLNLNKTSGEGTNRYRSKKELQIRPYFVEIIFNGLNLNAKRIKRTRLKYFVDVHRSELFYIIERVNQNIKSRVHKRRLLFFSYNSHVLTELIKKVKLFRVPDVYTGKGLYARTDKYKKKQGKGKRQ